MANTARNKPGVERVTIEDDNALEKLQGSYEKNKKMINGVVTVVLVLVLGFFGYKKLYQAPRESKASAAIAVAQRYFEMDSVSKALNGDGQNQGFLRVMKKYSGTKTANLCHYYAGICYLKMGDFKNAIKHLEDFDGKGTVAGYEAEGGLGDAYAETNNIKKAIEHYNKAAGDKNNMVLTPIYLFRAGQAYELDNKPEEAKKAYLRIRDEYPQSPMARDMDKLLARLGVVE